MPSSLAEDAVPARRATRLVQTALSTTLMKNWASRYRDRKSSHGKGAARVGQPVARLVLDRAFVFFWFMPGRKPRLNHEIDMTR